ncbi:MAG: Ca2+-dependent phosphoinositide-specific phospholipase C, partial [Longimicrobiales bacterium]|nr:Ca2+-dependent phosphoinositide-specific phospholipase C [Longimicrobiales bacterium]
MSNGDWPELSALRYDEIAFKASHNSIDRLGHLPWDESILQQLSGAGGLSEPCRGLELDLVQEEHRFRWSVKHGVNDQGPALPDVLQVIRSWADTPANRRHPVVTVHLDLKNDPLSHHGFAEALDDLLVDVFGTGRIHRPAHVMGDHADLVRGARAGGWATFAQLRGRLVFCLSGSARRKARYARNDPRSRVCFADYAGSRGAPRRGHRVFANLFVDADHYRENLARVKRHPGFVARGYNIVHRRSWDASVDGRANILSGDVLDSTDLSLGGDGLAP